MIRIAITGGIASGKSSAASRFAQCGFAVASADQFSRDLVAPGSEGLHTLVDAFGPEVLTPSGELDRAALRQRIFSDDGERRRLEALLHPRIREASRQWCDAQRDAGAAVVAIEIPLLVETAQQADFDHVVLVDVPTHIQIQRICARDRCDAESAQKVIDKQASREERLRAATDVLLNDATLDNFQADADALAQRLQSIYSADRRQTDHI